MLTNSYEAPNQVTHFGNYTFGRKRLKLTKHKIDRKFKKRTTRFIERRKRRNAPVNYNKYL